MANPLIQQAVSLEIDHTGIVDSVLPGVGSVPTVTIYPAAKTAEIAPVYNPSRAKDLLAQAGAVKERGR